MQLSRVRTNRGQRGLSLVELMVGVVVSLFVVAAASLLTTTQLSDNRRLLLETQLQQDLRSAADFVARDLRRSGYWAAHQGGTPAPTAGSTVGPNPGAAIGVDTATNTINYRYSRALGATAFGLKLENETIKSCQGEPGADGLCGGNYQELTDRRTVRITSFSVAQERAGASNNGDAIVLPCPNLCSNGSTTCWPRVAVREFVIGLTGVSTSDTSVTRSLTVGIRVRNDRVALSSEAPPDQACPIS